MGCSFPTRNADANVASFGSTVEMLSDVSLAHGVIRSHLSETVGMLITTAAGASSIASADGNIYTTGAQFTTSDTCPVKFNRSTGIRNYRTLASNLPTSGLATVPWRRLRATLYLDWNRMAAGDLSMIDPTAILALISDLYAQIAAPGIKNAELRKALEGIEPQPDR